MTRILVAYDSKYGNTKCAAETIAEGMTDVEGIEISVANVKETDVRKVEGYDVLVLGAPNHMASPSRTMTKFIESLAGLDLKAKNAAVFGTYSGRLRKPNRAVRKMEKKLKEKMPKVNLVSPVYPSDCMESLAHYLRENWIDAENSEKKNSTTSEEE